MKKLFLLSIATCFIMIATIISCGEREVITETITETTENQDQLMYGAGLVIKELNRTDRLIKITENTEISIDEKGASMLDLPKGYLFVYETMDGEIISSRNMGVKCTCTSGTGCHPTKSGGDYGCLMGSNCSTCKREGTMSRTGNAVHYLGTIKTKDKVSLERTSSEFPSFGEVLDLPEVKKNLQDIFKEFGWDPYKDEVSSGDYLKIGIYGGEYLIEVPPSVAQRYGAGIYDGGGCLCLTDGSCPKKSKLVVVWCDANACSSCQLD